MAILLQSFDLYNILITVWTLSLVSIQPAQIHLYATDSSLEEFYLEVDELVLDTPLACVDFLLTGFYLNEVDTYLRTEHNRSIEIVSSRVPATDLQPFATLQVAEPLPGQAFGPRSYWGNPYYYMTFQRRSLNDSYTGLSASKLNLPTVEGQAPIIIWSAEASALGDDIVPTPGSRSFASAEEAKAHMESQLEATDAIARELYALRSKQ